ncbi:trafficking protein particle complex subunit 6A isoform X1 [Leopardus geoffroyi]|uniref:trafficking protein particle complex subunit 6A isoform X1 n=1 Tax=Leopardus geoffroyi TaxID=46844 RepID=UPI001E264559|nr:trafficking protein particle complex subunit 6A isoform X1 [Leopardus geoffroyi]
MNARSAGRSLGARPAHGGRGAVRVSAHGDGGGAVGAPLRPWPWGFVEEDTQALMDGLLALKWQSEECGATPPASEACAVNAGPHFPACLPSRSPGGFLMGFCGRAGVGNIGVTQGCSPRAFKAHQRARDPAAPGRPMPGSCPPAPGWFLGAARGEDSDGSPTSPLPGSPAFRGQRQENCCFLSPSSSTPGPSSLFLFLFLLSGPTRVLSEPDAGLLSGTSGVPSTVFCQSLSPEQPCEADLIVPFYRGGTEAPEGYFPRVHSSDNQRGNQDSGFWLQNLSVASGLSLPAGAKFLEHRDGGSFICPRSTHAQELWGSPHPAWYGGYLGLLNGFFWMVTGGMED